MISYRCISICPNLCLLKLSCTQVDGPVLSIGVTKGDKDFCRALHYLWNGQDFGRTRGNLEVFLEREGAPFLLTQL